MIGADTCVCSYTRVRLRGHLEAYGVGDTTTATDGCMGVSWRGTGCGWWPMMGGRVCNVVVTFFDLHRLEMAVAMLGGLLLLCQG